ncbi:hypothetical protein CHH67_18845 [Paenibacillus campinasensis]|uniref:Transglycosylase n=1 Tax=Paenibacillus campinasensis TaxID=66347 RepID=A0A268ELA1_9BACL|nr:hypothetical protein CHH67_18845 [Paenibacillus campinasensis]
MKTHCDAGCQKAFTLDHFQQEKLNDGIEKTFYCCPHCGQQYVAFYADEEIRKLQARIRRVQKRFADPADKHEDAARKEAELQALIKEKMDALRARVEGGGGGE